MSGNWEIARLLGRRERPLAWHLTALCMVLAMPILAVQYLLAATADDAEQAQIRVKASTLARDVAGSIDRELAGLMATTQVLALSQHLQTGDLAAFDQQARTVYRILGINVVLRDVGAQQLVNTRLPWGSSLPANREPESDALAVMTKGPVVSNLFTGAVAGKPLFIVNVPVLRDDEVVYHLTLSVEPDRILRIVQQATAPSDDWTTIVADRHDKVVAKSVSDSVGPPLFDGMSALPNHHDRTAAEEEPGDAAAAALAYSGLSGWKVMVVIPKERMWSRLVQLMAGSGSAGAGILALSIGLAIVFSRRVGTSVSALAAQATLVGQGETVTRLATPVREVNMLSATLAEASEKRRAVEAALRESEERLRLAQTSGRIGTWDWDAASGRLTSSASCCGLYGLDPSHSEYRNVGEWLAQVHPEDRARVAKSREQALATGQYEDEYRIVRHDGSIRWIVDRGMGFFGQEGRLERLIGASIDVTETRESAERVRELQFELLHASRLSAMGQMAASLAHELNQPLGAAASFLGAAQMALTSEGPQARGRALARIGKASEQTLRAGAIVRRLRDFMGRGEAEKLIVDPRKLVVEAVALALVGIRDDKLKVRYAFDPEVKAVLVDRVQIQQVLFNLVRNALEATEGSEQRKIVLATHLKGNSQVEFFVSDTGPGLPPDPEALFKPFASSKPTGMGLGLSICRTIVEAHHGRLWAEANPEGGARFRFVIPAVEQLEESHVSQ